jgi:mannose-6-phosphate isomerase-like protein (cupin superfamily)
MMSNWITRAIGRLEAGNRQAPLAADAVGYMALAIVSPAACLVPPTAVSAEPAAVASERTSAARPATDVFAEKFAPGKDTLQAYRIYTGKDGHSHLETITFKGKRSPFFDANEGLFQVEGVDVQKEAIAFLQGRLAHVNIYTAPGNVNLPSHLSPGSEMFLILRGSATLTLRDGKEHTFVPGDLVIFEDTTGTGRGGRIGPDGFTAVNFGFVVQAPVSEAAKR